MPSAWKKLGRNLTGSRAHAFNSCSTEPPWMVLCFPGLPAVKEHLSKLEFDCSSSIAIYALPTCRPQDGEEAARGIISPQVMPTTWSFWKVAECVVYILVASNVQGALIYTNEISAGWCDTWRWWMVKDCVGHSCQNDLRVWFRGNLESGSDIGIRGEFVSLGFMSTTRQ